MRLFFIGDDNLKITGNDIFIYGDISESKIWEEDFTAKEFAEKIANLDEITLHINSSGGDIFPAITISNLIKTKDVTCIIEGICASAATIISSACKKVVICKNALFMIHDPTVELYNSFKAEELAKISNSLAKIKESIIETYVEKTAKSAEEIANLMATETWYSAAEAIEAGFADEISGESEIAFSNSILTANKIKFDCKNYDKKKMERVIEMDLKEKIRNEEISRVKALMDKRGDNEIVNSIIDVAISKGDKLADIEKYIEAVSKIKVSNALEKGIYDNLKSGVEGVIASSADDDEIKKRAKAIADFANKL